MEYKAFCEFCKDRKIEYKALEPMSLHTSFKIGGNADLFVSPSNKAVLCEIIGFLKERDIPYFILGKGSNLLVSDKGIEGVVISLLSLNDITVDGCIVKADAGASLATVCNVCLENSLKGLEFAYGIPGTVGGALYMNAGAYGGEMSQVVVSAEILKSDGNVETVMLQDMALGYRTSCFKDNGAVILSVSFKLEKGTDNEIKTLMQDYLLRRKTKQPLEYPSAGSTFKRPEGYFAGALIEKNGLKGKSVGNAEVSEKHAGFVINKGGATQSEVSALMKHIADVVKENDGVTLEPEVIFVGRR